MKEFFLLSLVFTATILFCLLGKTETPEVMSLQEVPAQTQQATGETREIQSLRNRAVFLKREIEGAKQMVAIHGTSMVQATLSPEKRKGLNETTEAIKRDIVDMQAEFHEIVDKLGQKGADISELE